MARPTRNQAPPATAVVNDPSPEAVSRRRRYRRLVKNVDLGQTFLWIGAFLFLLALVFYKVAPTPAKQVDLGWGAFTVPQGTSEAEGGSRQMLRILSGIILLISVICCAAFSARSSERAFRVGAIAMGLVVVHLMIWPASHEHRGRYAMLGICGAISTAAWFSARCVKRKLELEEQYGKQALILKRARRGTRPRARARS